MGTALSITLIIILIDQLSKNFILQNFAIGESITIIKNFFFITHVKNSGAAWGFLSDKAWGISILTLISIVVSAFLIYLIYINQFRVFRNLIAIILGGSIGNLIDRMRYNYVVDFLSFKFGEYYFPVFNIADISIVIGGILIVLYFLTHQEILDKIAIKKKNKSTEKVENKK